MASLALKKDEILFLLSKWQRAGLSKFEASNRMDKLKSDLHNLVIKLKNKGKDEDYINAEFHRRFELEMQKVEL